MFSRQCEIPRRLRLSRKTSHASHSRESGNPQWTLAFAGVTTVMIFIPLGGPKAHDNSSE
jgi:hypothetical protein